MDQMKLWTRVERFMARIPTGVLARPFEFFLAIASVLAGIIALIGIAPAASITALLPGLLQLLWSIELIAGGAAIAIGIVRNSALWEMAGLQLYGPTAVVYAIAIIVIVGTGGMTSILFYSTIALACGVRAYTLKVLQHALRSARKE